MSVDVQAQVVSSLSEGGASLKVVQNANFGRVVQSPNSVCNFVFEPGNTGKLIQASQVCAFDDTNAQAPVVNFSCLPGTQFEIHTRQAQTGLGVTFPLDGLEVLDPAADITWEVLFGDKNDLQLGVTCGSAANSGGQVVSDVQLDLRMSVQAGDSAVGSDISATTVLDVVY
ncbi:hypothetical protein [Ponticaulis sp.]|uniref:hypothetical protein n=1 Tax=Ponticaulis sp. TaxID=2020902 RepID=UPI00263088BA|nr:hypothetical protein [Ponticaulis sp.]MDF1679669.1 hypothetical protein [Ponticaulis sp.]